MQSVSFRTHLDSLGKPTSHSLLDLLLVSEKHPCSWENWQPSSAWCQWPCHRLLPPSLYSVQSQSTRVSSYLVTQQGWPKGLLNATLSEADWSNAQQAPDPRPDSAWLSWKSTFLKIAAEFVPSKMNRKLRPKLPWMTVVLKRKFDSSTFCFADLNELAPLTTELHSRHNETRSRVSCGEQNKLTCLPFSGIPETSQMTTNFWSTFNTSMATQLVFLSQTWLTKMTTF